MGDSFQVRLEPSGSVFEVERGASLSTVLFGQGIEFPCGGRGCCGGCKVRVLAGQLASAPVPSKRLSAREMADGWRLACRCQVDGPVTLEVAQWETPILVDQSPVVFTPQDGLGIAVDVGTTTLVAQLLDLRTGHVLAVQTALNAQAAFGADIMSRVELAVSGSRGAFLTQLLRDQVGGMVRALILSAHAGAVRRIVLVGNTVMHHLFAGLDLAPLSHFPFASPNLGWQNLAGDDLGWALAGQPVIEFLPCFGGFVGADLLAGILATRLDESVELVGLMDLGTNGEIIIGNRDRLLCASTAAGPAFEGARISMGMRAATGAIAEVNATPNGWDCRVLGSGPPRGICGSGLVDAVAVGLETGQILPSGRLAHGAKTLPLQAPVILTQADLREVQLAKGALAAGLDLLLETWGTDRAGLTKLYLAGAFGNYLNLASARRIGLVNLPLDRLEPAGNTALRGAKIALLHPAGETGDFAGLRARMEHVSLEAVPGFQEVYLGALGFPP